MKLTVIIFLCAASSAMAQFKLRFPSHIAKELTIYGDQFQIEAVPDSTDQYCWLYKSYCIDENGHKVIITQWLGEPLITMIDSYQSSHAYTRAESKKIMKYLKKQ